MGKPNVHQNDEQQTSITYFSHVHPLHFTNLNNHQFETLNPYKNSSCSACKLAIFGSVYSCHLCNFFLHSKCSQMPQRIKHPFDRNNHHILSLLPTPVYPEGYFRCDACGKEGNGFSYHCDICTIDLHVLCASMPLSSSHHSHHHELHLSFFSPYQNNEFSCDVCKSEGSNSWLYRCDHCEFDAHLDCATTKLARNPIWPTPISPNGTITPIPSQTQNLRDKLLFDFTKEVSEIAGEQVMLNVLTNAGIGGGDMFLGTTSGSTGGGSGIDGVGHGGMDPTFVSGVEMNVDVVGARSGEI